MNVNTISESLGLSCKCCRDKLEREITGGYTGDLLSDVMAHSKAGDIWVTRQVHANVIAVAALKELAAVVVVQGALPDPDTVERASREGIPILATDMSAFETVGRIYRLLNPER
jgi:hypothetical protein